MVKFNERLFSLIKKRRSVRIFNGKKIPRRDILSIIEAGTWAPTGCNNQELRFAILDSKEEINDIIRFKSFLKGISAFILIFCDMSLPMSKIYYKRKHEKNLPYIDTGLALMNMMLVAKSKNIDSCVCNLSEYHVGRFNANEIKSYLKKLVNALKLKLNLHSFCENSFIYYLKNRLKISNHLKIMAGLALGYAERYPDVNKGIHGRMKIMREDVDYYILPKGVSDRNK